MLLIKCLVAIGKHVIYAISNTRLQFVR
jgi:hypothetical protein